MSLDKTSAPENADSNPSEKRPSSHKPNALKESNRVVMSTPTNNTLMLSSDEKLSLERKNYGPWFMQISLAFEYRDLLGVADSTENRPPAGDAGLAAWLDKNKKVRTQIGLNVAADTLVDIDATTSKSMLDSLKNRFQGMSVLAQSMAMAALASKKYMEGMEMKTHINELCRLKVQVVGSGLPLDDKHFAMIAIQSLPSTSEWNAISDPCTQ